MPQINEFSWTIMSLKMIILMLMFLVSMNMMFETFKVSKIKYNTFYFNLII